MREKDKPQWKLSYKLLKEQYVYNPLLGIYPFPTWIQLKDSLCGIQPCVTVIGNGISDSNITFAPHLNCDELDYYCTNDNETKIPNGHMNFSSLDEKFMTLNF